ncbi:MAG: site-2 protease family protein [Anaerolineales bacterium]|nr:site-2 protease family protein [Anaerolineales bacterium]
MGWSIKLGRFAGIDVYVHITFPLLLGFIGFTAYLSGGTLASALESVAYIAVLFGCVLLHEFGHSLMARYYHIPTRDITLYPIGGVARLERMPDKPIQELWVALAGPAVNVVIAAVLFAFLLVTGGLTPLSRMGLVQGPFWERVMYANIALVVFNLIPAFPMDGGRVLRAFLAMVMDYTRATQIAATLGQGAALLFGFLGLFSSPLLIFIAFFIWMAASQEASLVQMKSALGGIPVNRAMLTDFRTLSQHDPLLRAIDLIIGGSQEDFPVVDDGRVVGVLTRHDLLTALAQKGTGAQVGEVMQRDFFTADPYEMLEPLFIRMQTAQVRTVPVLSRDQLVGLLTLENIGEFLMIQAAMKARRQATGRA